ncbi:MAG: hypothetical protein J6W09_04595 [Bacteroidales bacterium]|nr:hypothetical protein [Bacteroidales bacterium]
MPDYNSEASNVWDALKPAIDGEIDQRTRGMVQRRKAKVTTAPSLVTNKIGVTEPYGTEIFIPFVSNLASAVVGDYVWVEFMYGANNSFASMFASADSKDQTVAGNLTVGGVLDVTQRRCEATLSSEGWYRAIVYNAYDTNSAQGSSGEIVTIRIVYTSLVSVQHEISLWMSYGKVAFLNETSHGTTNLVDKIRYTHAGAVGYVDIHVTSSSSVQYNVSFDVASRTYAQERWVAGTLASVAPAPSGETVLTEYTFHANGTGDLTVNGVLDLPRRRAMARLQASTSSGQWYNVLVFDAQGEAGGGAIGVIIDFNICRIWQAGSNEVHKISLLLRGLADGTYAKFTNENTTSGTVEIDKIRYRHNTASKKAYVDIHYNYTSGNVVQVDYDVHCSSYGYQERFTSGGLTAVADAPAYNGTSDTIDAVYSFDTNCYLAPLAYRNHSSSAVTVAAGATSSVNITIGLNNYFPIAIVSVFGNGSSGFSLSDWYLSNATTARLYFRNNNSSSQTVTWTVTILYQKN